jgi:hypothetical protein
MNEVFHRIKHLNRNFTQQEWADYCEASRKDDDNRIQTKIGKYIWNDCDICLNPESWLIETKHGAYGYSVEIKWAECRNGIFAFGISYNCGTEGGSFGVSWADKADVKVWNKGFESEKECKRFALRYALTRLIPKKDNKEIDKLRAKIQEELDKLQKPQWVQLELF